MVFKCCRAVKVLKTPCLRCECSEYSRMKTIQRSKKNMRDVNQKQPGAAIHFPTLFIRRYALPLSWLYKIQM